MPPFQFTAHPSAWIRQCVPVQSAQYPPMLDPPTDAPHQHFPNPPLYGIKQTDKFTNRLARFILVIPLKTFNKINLKNHYHGFKHMIRWQYNYLRESSIKWSVYNPTSIISVRYTLLPVPDLCEYGPLFHDPNCSSCWINLISYILIFDIGQKNNWGLKQRGYLIRIKDTTQYRISCTPCTRCDIGCIIF